MDNIYHTGSKPNFFKGLFSGRMRRLGYFGRGVLLNIIIGIFTAVVSVMLEDTTVTETAAIVVSVVTIVVVVCVLFFCLSIMWRRLHDINLPGPLAFIVIGLAVATEAAGFSALKAMVYMVSLLLLFIPGTKGPNKYGPDPLGRFGSDDIAERVFGGEPGIRTWASENSWPDDKQV